MRNKTIGYDNVCGLAAVVKNLCRSSFSDGAKLLAKLNFVHDRLYLEGHTNPLCRTHYNLENIPGSAKWNSECAEQEFEDFSQHKKLIHHSSRERSAIWVLLIFHEKNLQNDKKINNSKGAYSRRVRTVVSIDKQIKVLTDILRMLP